MISLGVVTFKQKGIILRKRTGHPFHILRRNKGKIMSTSNSLAARSRRGFTLVELLVVIAIIGVLVGLLMPAIINARTTALQATCANNESEIAKAMILFDTNKDRLPYSGQSDIQYGSWCTSILEELGLGKQNEQFMDGNLVAQPIKQFKCPMGDAKTNGINYVANTGRSDLTCNTNNPNNDVRGAGLLFFYNGNKTNTYTKSSISSIHDGASYTILIAEECNTIPGGYSGNTPADDWRGGDNLSKSETAAKTRFGMNWSNGILGSQKSSDYYPNFPSSRHSQINNVAFADGSVRAVSKTIYYKTFACLMAPHDKYAGLGSYSYADDPNFKQ